MEPITVETTINASIEKVWECWTAPQHITQWAFASSDWEAPEAENDLRPGGTFKTVMAAKDGSARFDFTGTYTAIEPHARIAYTMDDGRAVHITFTPSPQGVVVTETFDPETENSPEIQRDGWQSILNNFKAHVEAQA